MTKLTAKLSDGREYEVMSTFMKRDGTEVQLFCEPIKPEPPKEIWANIYPDGDRLFYSDREAVEILGRPERIGGKALRYVLASEPEKKPREWWAVVREVEGTHPVAKLCTSEDEALRMAMYEAITNAGKYDVRRMREVEE